MRDDIKKRIEAVRCGEVPEGYFRTRAGLMPVDWNTDCRAKSIFKNHSNKNHDGKYEVLSATQDRGIIPRSEVDIDIKFDEGSLATYKKVDVGDFVISLRSFQGGIEYSEYEGLVSPAYTVLKPCKPIDSGYYRAYFKTQDFINRLNGAVYGIRDGKQIGYEDFGDLMIHCPPIEEQQRIAEILSACDRVIELKQKLVAELQQLKKICLAKMFPQKGCVTPEIRFPGFTVPWNLCKIGTLSDEFRSGDFIKAESIFEDGAYPVYGGNGVRGYTDSYNHDGDYAIIGRQGALCGNVNYVTGKAYFTEHAVAVKANQANETRFLFYCFSNMNLRQFSDQSAQPGLAVNKLVKLETMIPSKAEQEQISAFLTSLDSTIILNKRELEEIQQKKKALMQLLLTGLVRVNV